MMVSLQKGWCMVVCIWFSFICDYVNGTKIIEGKLFINTSSPIATTDENFVCATIDLWPEDKCDYGNCSWGKASLLNLDLSNIVLFNAIKSFAPLKMRLGGTLQDRLIYQTEGSSEPCVPFVKDDSQIYNFTEGCMSLARWDELNSFLNQAGAHYIFGINALNGKVIQPNRTATGSWDSTNAESLIRYTFNKGYKVDGWELGNELGGRMIEVSVDVDPYVEDTIALHSIIQRIYKGVDFKPMVMAPGGILGDSWYEEYINKTDGILNVITHHIYDLGSGADENLVSKILNPSENEEGIGVLKNLSNILKKSRTSTVAWVSESGGAYGSGRDGVSKAFVFSFWYLDILGLASIYNTKTFCRQTLVGGNYGMLNTTTFVPNPDYYSGLLWHRLMGPEVLATRFNGTEKIRAYAHCAKQSRGITVLLINLDGNTTVHVNPYYGGSNGIPLPIALPNWREEYNLTPMDGNILSRTVMLNGKALNVGSNGTIPDLEPVRVHSSQPIMVNPHSIVFVHMPDVHIQACNTDTSERLVAAFR